MRTLSAVLAATVITGAVLVVPARAAAPSVELQPEALPRGADIAIPHIVAGEFVDGARRIELPGAVARVIGRSGDAWLVGTSDGSTVGSRRVVRVAADNAVTTVLLHVDPAKLVLAEDGSALYAVGRYRKDGSATVRSWSPVDGTFLHKRSFRRYPHVVTADGGRVLVRTTKRTVWWRVGAKRVRTVTTRPTGMASIEHDLLATYTKDPYVGGCLELTRLGDRSDVVWRSCRERVAAISPDGTQLLTFGILTDGVGPGQIRLREVDGTRLATWTTNWFSGWEWESPSAVLLAVNGRRKSATVRCTLVRCENATDPVRAQSPRAPGAGSAARAQGSGDETVLADELSRVPE